MTKQDKVQLVETMLATLRGSMLAGVEAVPEEFNGYDIRRLLVDEAKRFDMRDTNIRRTRAYRNWYVTSPTF